MVIGLGTDIVSVERIRKVFTKNHGEAFKERVFTPHEIEYCSRMANSGPHYAARWALKEAFYKALPEEMQPLSSWTSIEIRREAGRKPQLIILDKRLQEIFSQSGILISHHSISHEREYCVATVILESSSQS